MLLYLHIPYCDSKCYYCSFNSYVDKFDTRESYMEAILVQLKREFERFEVSKSNRIETVFIGGGTPSKVDYHLYSRFFDEIRGYLRDDAEITTEANPNSATKSWLEGMLDLGVNRLSLGVQSFDDSKLKALGRSHSREGAIRAVETAKEVGFKRVSLDLIYNFQGDSRELLESDIDLACSLGVEHISAYELTIEENTPFFSNPKVAQESDTLAKFVASHISSRGLKQYEVSNYGQVSRHNLGYWEQKEYIGIGAGAVGFRRDFRVYPTESIEGYISSPTREKIEKLSEDELILEKLFLGLRSKVGVELSILDEKRREAFEILINEGKIYTKDGRFYSKELFLADEVALFLLS